MKSTNIAFASAELQKALDEARPFIEGVEEAMTRVSNDIKALETYLQNLELKREFRFGVGKSFVPNIENTHSSIEHEDYEGCTIRRIEEEALVWGMNVTGAFRLLFEVTSWIEVDFDLDYMRDEGTLQRHTRPLIETTFEVRKRMYEHHLADFITKLGDELRVSPPTRSPRGDDLPF